jgi:filamentous hemagglutinin family protein
MKHTTKSMKSNIFLIVLGLSTAAYYSIPVRPTFANDFPVVTDGTTNTFVSQGRSEYTVEGSEVDSTGRNLFHSFSVFSIPESRGVEFRHDPGVRNIIVRVTGRASQIDGRVRVTGNTNLFLLNPQGISFGKYAQLDIGGAFVATTADGVQFQDQGIFSSSPENSDTSVLRVDPSALLFSQFRASGDIVLSETLADAKYGPSSNWYLVGRNISIDNLLGRGKTRARFGGVIGLAGEGYVGLSFHQNNLHLTYPQNISPANLSFVNSDLVIDQGVVAQNLLVQSSSIDFENIDVDENFQILNNSSIVSENHINVAQNASAPTARNTVFLIRGSEVRASSIRTASSAVSITGASSLQADVLRVATNDFKVRNSSINTGISNVDALNSIFLDNSADLLSSSEIRIRTIDLTLNDSSISTRSSDIRDAGRIVIHASNQITLNQSSGLFSDVTRDGIGTGGSIIVRANRLILNNDSQISTSNLGQGNAGRIRVSANSVELAQRSQLTAETGEQNTGVGGNIQLGQLENPLNLLRLRDGSNISTESNGSGNSGNIQLDVLRTNSSGNSDIRASASVEQGGNVTVNGELSGIQYSPLPTPDGDINGTGIVTINGTRFSYDPNQRLVAIPTDLIDVSNQVHRRCDNPQDIGRYIPNEFMMTGRGGISQYAMESLSEWNSSQNWITSDLQENEPTISRNFAPTLISPEPPPIEAQGWVINAKGQVVLTVDAPNKTSTLPSEISCPRL